MITKDKIKWIWALANKIDGLDDESLHTLVFQLTGNEHISRLTDLQTTKVIMELTRLSRQVTKNGLMSEGQKKKIFKFMYDLDWTHTFKNGRKTLNTKRLDGFCSRTCNVALYTKMTYYQASKVIEGLKKMVERGQNE